MAESYSKSKLKRKKSSVEDTHQDLSSRIIAKKKDSSTLFASDITSETNKSVVPAAAWWNREQLSAVESLWVLTLKSALPYLDNQHRDLVPDLPHPSTAKSKAWKLHEQQWCDLNEEVSPFPEPTPPSPKTSSCSDPRRLSTSQQDLSLQSKPVPDPPDRQQSFHSKQSHEVKTTTLQSLTEKTKPPLHSWEEAASSAGFSDVGRKGREQAEPQARTVSRQILANKMVSDRRSSLPREDENKEEVVQDKAVEEVQAGSGRDGVGELQNCPMCLMVFPVGFTQMDCDCHLAQCLSDMNVDMTW